MPIIIFSEFLFLSRLLFSIFYFISFVRSFESQYRSARWFIKCARLFQFGRFAFEANMRSLTMAQQCSRSFSFHCDNSIMFAVHWIHDGLYLKSQQQTIFIVWRYKVVKLTWMQKRATVCLFVRSFAHSLYRSPAIQFAYFRTSVRIVSSVHTQIKCHKGILS